jgi:hypothetical protein
MVSGGGSRLKGLGLIGWRVCTQRRGTIRGRQGLAVHRERDLGLRGLSCLFGWRAFTVCPWRLRAIGGE